MIHDEIMKVIVQIKFEIIIDGILRNEVKYSNFTNCIRTLSSNKLFLPSFGLSINVGPNLQIILLRSKFAASYKLETQNYLIFFSDIMQEEVKSEAMPIIQVFRRPYEVICDITSFQCS
jgi:hypothetical protein